MAELALLRFSLGVAWSLFTKSATGRLQCGSLADERLRQILLNEFQKLHEHLNALRRKELVAAVAFMENGYELLKSSPQEAIKEFNKARDSAQMAFGVVPDISDRVLATKILVTAAIHEFPSEPEVAKTLCLKYLTRLNSLPEIVKECKIFIGSTLASKFMAVTGSKKTHGEILGNVSNINRCVWQFVKEFFGDEEIKWPCVQIDKSSVNILHPVMDLILSRDYNQLDLQGNDLVTPVAIVICKKKLFIAFATKFVTEGQTDNQYLNNALRVVNLETMECSTLTGHNSNVLCLVAHGDQVFSGAYNKTILVWDANSLECLRKVSSGDHDGSIRSLCTNPRYLFSACSGAFIIVWDLKTLEKIQTLKEELPISVVNVTDRFLFSGSLNGAVKIWDLKSWSILQELSTKDMVISLHSRHNYLIVQGKKSVQTWNLGSMKCIKRIDCVSQCATVIRSSIFTCFESVINQWDIETGKCVSSITVLPQTEMPVLSCLCFDYDTGYLYLGGSYKNNEGYLLKW